jgi:hypothetical protein
MAANLRKQAFAREVQGVATALAQVSDKVADLNAVWLSRKLGSTDPVTDEDVADLRITAAQVTSFFSLADRLVKLMSNQSSTPIAGEDILNVLRNDM